ncbi:hypothetical protein [Leptospira licerasiae]|uniref:Transposase n=1 Tax=Leptospira licerasiae str. MMD4847 TaxID=1049971 RepID=A0ABN0H939_9LEPT|nr:hypothetical protein [Leptospira licerasiae]EIE01497.1 hypothetical protein LEP1GSC185_3974 [Leptospira licerasiae serovar Varillal str. VAR 010]EJZ42280.1 hypothetical protein LEP1GSC178_0042 [Leptospira licerasiae str. MMD4847]
MKPPSLEILNRLQVRAGEKPVSGKVHKLILQFFTAKEGKFQPTVFASYRPALRKEGIRLFSMKFECPLCEDKKDFTHFRYSESINGFYEVCKECGITDYQGFIKFNKRRVQAGLPELTLAAYKKLKKTYHTRFGYLNPHIQRAIQKMIQVFGKKVLREERDCKYCADRKILALFTPEYKKKKIYFKCRVCTAIDQATRRAEARKKKKRAEEARIKKRMQTKDRSKVGRGRTTKAPQRRKRTAKIGLVSSGR